MENNFDSLIEDSYKSGDYINEFNDKLNKFLLNICRISCRYSTIKNQKRRIEEDSFSIGNFLVKIKELIHYDYNLKRYITFKNKNNKEIKVFYISIKINIKSNFFKKYEEILYFCFYIDKDTKEYEHFISCLYKTHAKINIENIPLLKEYIDVIVRTLNISEGYLSI